MWFNVVYKPTYLVSTCFKHFLMFHFMGCHFSRWVGQPPTRDGGFHKWSYPLYRWMVKISWKIHRTKWMRTGGTIFGNPHIMMERLRTSVWWKRLF